MLLKQFKAFSINLNAQDVNEMTHIESRKMVKNTSTFIRYSRVPTMVKTERSAYYCLQLKDDDLSAFQAAKN